MIKILIFILGILMLFSTSYASGPLKEVNLATNRWIQVINYNDNEYKIEENNITFSTYPSFLIIKNIENSKNGYLVKIWIASNTQQNGHNKNINLSDISILYFDGINWQENFNVSFLVVGQTSTQVHYFFTKDPNVQVKFRWRTSKINNY